MQREGRDMQRVKGEGGAAECYLRVRKHPIYTSFFKCWLVKPIQFDSVRFNRFQTLETEPNRNCFVIF